MINMGSLTKKKFYRRGYIKCIHTHTLLEMKKYILWLISWNASVFAAYYKDRCTVLRAEAQFPMTSITKLFMRSLRLSKES